MMESGEQTFAQRQKAVTFFSRFRIREDDTPEGLKMQNDDVIDAVAEQTGGF